MRLIVRVRHPESLGKDMVMVDFLVDQGAQDAIEAVRAAEVAPMVGGLTLSEEEWRGVGCPLLASVLAGRTEHFTFVIIGDDDLVTAAELMGFGDPS